MTKRNLVTADRARAIRALTRAGKSYREISAIVGVSQRTAGRYGAGELNRLPPADASIRQPLGAYIAQHATGRDQEIGRGIVEGLTNAKIAERIGFSPGLVAETIAKWSARFDAIGAIPPDHVVIGFSAEREGFVPRITAADAAERITRAIAELGALTVVHSAEGIIAATPPGNRIARAAEREGRIVATYTAPTPDGKPWRDVAELRAAIAEDLATICNG